MSEDFIKEVGSIKPEQWKRITETLKVVKGFMDVDTGVLEAFKEDIKSTLSLKMEELLSPIQNSIDELWATALEPIMPFLQDVVGGIAVIIGWLADRVQDIIDFFDTEQTQIDYPRYQEWARLFAVRRGNFPDYNIWIANQASKTSTYLPSRRGGVQEP